MTKSIRKKIKNARLAILSSNDDVIVKNKRRRRGGVVFNNKKKRSSSFSDSNVLDMIIFNDVANGTNVRGELRRDIAKRYVRLCDWDRWD